MNVALAGLRGFYEKVLGRLGIPLRAASFARSTKVLQLDGSMLTHMMRLVGSNPRRNAGNATEKMIDLRWRGGTVVVSRVNRPRLMNLRRKCSVT
jgi:hypothetical protein